MGRCATTQVTCRIKVAISSPHAAVRRAAVGLAAAAMPLICAAQTGLFESLDGLRRSVTNAVSPSTSASAAASAPVASPTAGDGRTQGALSASAAASASLARLEPSQQALNELRPDSQCLKVEERFDIFDKAADYAGTAAQLRLQTLLSSDFQQSQLSESDKKLLQYLAYTTVWIPSSIETRVGEAWSMFSSKGGDVVEPSQRTQRAALARQAERLEEIRASINGFPGAARVVLEPDLHDGALSRVGGLMVVSPRFLSLMDEQDGVRDVLLAHELSHLYKRHALKELQYQLISTATGWNVAKKLMRREMPTSYLGATSSVGSIVNGVSTAIENGRLVKDLVEVIRDTQTKYNVTQEYEADACALRWLKALNVEPQAAWVTFSAVLQDPGPDAAASYGSLHPSPKDRDTNVAKMLGKPIDMPPTAAGPPASSGSTKRVSTRSLPAKN